MAKISAPTVGLGADAKVGCKEAGDHKEQRGPQGHDERDMGAAEE